VARKAEGIVAELRRRIVAGELRPGDTVPSAKDIMGAWGVSMGPAYHALTIMRQDGLAEPVAGGGHGMIVTQEAISAASVAPAPPAEGAETRALMVRTAIEVADADGLAVLSFRRLAERLDIAIMTLYTFVRDRAQLEMLMSDSIFAEFPPAPVKGKGKGGWRGQLELVARTQWQMYRAHPWLADIVSFRHAQFAPHVAAHSEWAMRALAGLGLAPETAQQAVATIENFVRGNAMNLEQDAETRAAQAAQDDTEFELGLQRLLDGFARLA